ncbi:MAG: hypothetical protein NT092_04175 [Bacteroidia bacterium]|nr:hypothetical protein [Bacteroidia bacterium]
MGTKINMVSVSWPFFPFSRGSSISMSSRAAKKCLGNAGIDPSEIGLLINTGIYRYRNTGEPSIASLVQKKIMGYQPAMITRTNMPARDTNTFSFDLNKGACGWIAGIQIIDGFIQTGDIRHGIVVTGDSEPFRGFSENYLFDSAAAAIILSVSETTGGFSDFRTYSYPDLADEFISSTRFGHLDGKWGKRNILKVEQKTTYLEKCIGCAAESLKKYLDETGLTIKEIDLIIPSQSPGGLVSGLRERTGLGNKIVEITNTRNRELHTAGPAFALKQAWDDASFRASKNILFLTAGSGMSVSIVYYKNIS